MAKGDVVKSEPAIVIDKRSIGALRRAVKRKRLNRDQHELLRALIVQIERTESEGDGLGTTVRYNLQVIDTQIRDVLEKTGGASFDEDAIAKMPPSMQARIVERLENVAARIEAEGAQTKIKSYSTSTFACLKDYQGCRAAAEARSYWCTIALLVCLAGDIGESFITGRSK